MSKEKWIPLMIKRKFYPFTMLCIYSGLLERYDRGSLTAWEDGLNSTYAEKELVKKDTERLKQALRSDPFWVDEFVAWAIKQHQKPVKVAKKCQRKDLRNFSDKELADLEKELIQAEEEVGKAVIVLATDNRIEQDLRGYLEEKNLENSTEVMEKIIAPTRKSAEIKRELSFLKLLRTYNQKEEIDTDLEEKIKEHINNFVWTGVGTGGEKLTYAKVTEELREADEDSQARIESIKKDLNQTKKERQQIFEKHNFSDFYKACANYISESTYIRIYRKETQSQMAYYGEGLFEELASRLGIEKEELMFLGGRQVIDALEKNKKEGKLRELAAAQKKLSVCHLQEGGSAVYIHSDEAEDFLEEELGSFRSEQKKKIEGRPIYAGRAKGEAKVVIDSQNIDKVKEGDILVATQTTPDFTPGIKKAAGVVVEEGGITSHASIICREMQVPAVIGVNGATDIFNDGDQIDLNAEKGKVRKI